MTQRSNSAPTPLCQFGLRSLVHSITWLGAFSLLSNNLVLAQTPGAVVVPTVEQSKPLTVKSTANAPSLPRVELRQKLSQPQQQARQSSTLAPRPLITREPQIKVYTPKVRSLPAPSTSLPISVQVRPNSLKKTVTNSARNYNSTYIDPTKYNIGATKSYEPPSSVVFSERSTGCQAVLRQGQGLSGSVCATARGQRTQVAIRGGRSINTARLSRFPGQRRGVNVSGIAPIRVGAISVSSNGFRPNRQTALPQIGGVIPRGVVSYNRTLRPTKLGTTNSQLMFPLTIPASVTSLFGWRIHPITGTRRFHSGTDLGAPLGTPVLAAYEGNVVIADFLGGYGLTIVIDHNKFTEQTLYAHLSEVFVQPGEWVEQGTVIGRVGSTGNSTGPHLHFEARQLTSEGWVATDPGVKLESAFAQLVEALRANHVSQKPEKS